jgi:hypothetical protein
VTTTELRTGPRHLDHDVLGTGAVTETDDAPPAVRQAEDLEGGRDRVVVVRPVGPPADRDHRARPDQQGHSRAAGSVRVRRSTVIVGSSVSLAYRAVTP